MFYAYTLLQCVFFCMFCKADIYIYIIIYIELYCIYTIINGHNVYNYS